MIKRVLKTGTAAVIAVGMLAGALPASAQETISEAVSEVEAAGEEIPGISENGFLPVASVDNWVDSSYESSNINEYGQLSVGGSYVYCLGTWDSVLLTGEGREQYPQLAKKLDEINSASEEKGYQLLNETWAGAEIAGEQGLIDEEYANYQSAADVYLSRCDETVLSFMRHDVWYEGNVYYEDMKTGWSLDPKTGEDVTVLDVFTNGKKAYDTFAARMEEYFPKNSYEYMYGQMKAYFDGQAVEGISMAVGYEDVTLYIQPQVSYTNETIVEALPYRETPEIFNPAYTGHQKGYVTEVLCDTYFTGQFNADLNKDGVSELVLNMSTKDEYGNITGGEIICGEKVLDYEMYGYATKSYLVKTDDEKYYLYTVGFQENDWEMVYVADLNGEEFSFAGDISGGVAFSYAESFHEPWSFLDPDNFKLRTRAMVLSTCDVMRDAKAGSDGMPEFMEEYWYYIHGLTLTAKQEFKAKAVGEDGAETGDVVTVPAGTELVMYRSDMEGTEDLKDSAGNIYRIYVGSEWPRNVDGVEIEELFDGIIFAG